MYSIKRIDGKYLAMHKKNRNDIYIVPEDIYRKILRNGINKDNIPDGVFINLKQTYSSISPYDCFDVLDQKQLHKAKDVLVNSDEGLKKIRKKQANTGNKIKVNKAKSKKVKAFKIRVFSGLLSVIMAFSGATLLVKKMRSKNKDNHTVITNTNNDFDSKKDENKVNNRYENDAALDFYYGGYDVSEESAKNAMQYLDLCKKYGDMYGEDYRLLMGTLAQELNGNHKLELDTAAVGVAQIEKKEWLNTCLIVYNQKEKKIEKKWLIGPNTEDTIDDEEFKKRPKSDDIIAKYGIDNTINIETVEGSIQARAMIDAYNAEQAYKNGALDSISSNDFQAYVKARENKGPVVYKALKYGDDWKNHLDITENGDDDYYKKIYAFADIISSYCQDNSPYITRVHSNDETIIFAINALQDNKMAKTK